MIKMTDAMLEAMDHAWLMGAREMASRREAWATMLAAALAVAPEDQKREEAKR
jgi:hypothetical protein